MTLSHHWPLITHTPLVAGNLPVKLWLLGDGQKLAIIMHKTGLDHMIVDVNIITIFSIVH